MLSLTAENVHILNTVQNSVVADSFLLLLPLFVGVCVWSLFCNAAFSVLSSFASISPRKRELVALL